MIEVKGVTKGYNGEPVLKGITLTIGDGEFVSIMGRSGSGKSTLLNIIGGFLTPDGGTVLHNGKDIYALTDEQTAKMRCNDLGFVFQSFKLIPTLCVRDNVMLPASLSSCDKETVRKNYERFMKKLDIAALADKFPGELSGGQCQRVAIARALTYAPSILILDEPTGALDSANEKSVMNILSEVNEKDGTTIVMVTHSATVADCAKRKITLKDGTI
ncbi:MAG: ABC transporter ATP-binding protein [Clostridia bacterium]|nr:ABC transporter ATP-binding protein [Clostridia bacterium]